jgi:hypothetical protein
MNDRNLSWPATSGFELVSVQRRPDNLEVARMLWPLLEGLEADEQFEPRLEYCEVANCPPASPSKPLSVGIARFRDERYLDRLDVEFLLALAARIDPAQVTEEETVLATRTVYRNVDVGADVVVALMIRKGKPPYLTFVHLKVNQQEHYRVLLAEATEEAILEE